LAGASAQPGSPLALDQFLQDVVLDINQWPVLRELACNRADPWIPAEDALALYERNWRFVDPVRHINSGPVGLSRKNIYPYFF